MTKKQPNEYYQQLAQKFAAGTISDIELREYADWLNALDPDAVLEIPVALAASEETHRKKIYESIRSRIDIPAVTSQLRIGRSLRAAAVITAISMLGYFAYLLLPANNTTVVAVSPKPVINDVPAGTNGAVLQLANGKVIVLDTAANGSLGNNVMKSREAIVFKDVAGNETVQYNTLSTPRARQQQLVLPDGSHIWLNAESSIRFPTRFMGETREVSVTGEAYFEVATNKAKPFIVTVNKASVVVTGTSFNVMAYANEPVLETTLLEGRVQFRHNNSQLVLQPGQQSRLLLMKDLKLNASPDLELVMAWKNGFQSFKNAGIETILRKVTRWYDVDVELSGKAPEGMTFSGEVPREVTLLQLLKALESTDLQFSLDAANKKLRVQFESAHSTL